MPNLFVTLLQVAPNQTLPPTYANSAAIWGHMSDALHRSLYNVLSLFVAILPGILAFFIALGVFALIGVVLSALLRRGLTWVKFDDRVIRHGGHTDWTPSHSPAALMARAAFWTCVLLGLLIGVSAFETSYAIGATVPFSFLPYLARIVGAIFLLVAGNLVARFLERSVLIGAVNAQLQYARFLALGVKWLVLVLTAAMVLDHLEIGGIVVELAFGILFGGIVLTLALAVGLGSRDLISRSLESHIEHSGEHSAAPPAPPTAGSDDSISHF
jgi:hypothetical protein